MNEVKPNDLNGIGMALGAALAGSSAAARALATLSAEDEALKQLVEAFLQMWDEIETFSRLLDGIAEVADEFKRASGELPS